MKKNRLIIIITIVLAIIALLFILTNSRNTFKGEIRNFAVQDTSSISKIFMTDKANNQVTLSREQSANWKLNDKFSARKDAVNILLKTLLQVSVLEPVSKASHNSVIKRLAANSVKIEIYKHVYRINIFNWIKLFPHEKLTKTYYIGGATQNNIGTYMLMEHSSVPFITYIPGFRGFISIRYSALEADWRDHTIFNQRFSEIRSVKLEFPENPRQSYVVINNDNKTFSLSSMINNKHIENFDTLKVLDYFTSFDNIKFEALLNNINIAAKDSIINSQPFHILTLTNTSGEEITVKTFHKYSSEVEVDLEGNPVLYDRDRLFALVNNDKDFVLIQFFVFDKILRPLSYFQNSNGKTNN